MQMSAGRGGGVLGSRWVLHSSSNVLGSRCSQWLSATRVARPHFLCPCRWQLQRSWSWSWSRGLLSSNTPVGAASAAQSVPHVAVESVAHSMPHVAVESVAHSVPHVAVACGCQLPDEACLIRMRPSPTVPAAPAPLPGVHVARSGCCLMETLPGGDVA